MFKATIRLHGRTLLPRVPLVEGCGQVHQGVVLVWCRHDDALEVQSGQVTDAVLSRYCAHDNERGENGEGGRAGSPRDHCPRVHADDRWEEASASRDEMFEGNANEPLVVRYKQAVETERHNAGETGALELAATVVYQPLHVLDALRALGRDAERETV